MQETLILGFGGGPETTHPRRPEFWALCRVCTVSRPTEAGCGSVIYDPFQPFDLLVGRSETQQVSDVHILRTYFDCRSGTADRPAVPRSRQQKKSLVKNTSGSVDIFRPFPTRAGSRVIPNWSTNGEDAYPWAGDTITFRIDKGEE